MKKFISYIVDEDLNEQFNDLFGDIEEFAEDMGDHEHPHTAEECVRMILKKEGGAAGLETIQKGLKDMGHSEDAEETIANMSDVKQHRDGDYILENLDEANLQEMKAGDIKKKLSKVKGLSKAMMDQLVTLPMPVLTTMVNQLSTLVAGYHEETDLSESGHTDVASMKTRVKVAMMAIQKMDQELSKLPDDGELPTWWTNKVAIAVDKLDGMADYLDTKVESADLKEMKMPKGYTDNDFVHIAKAKVGSFVNPQTDKIIGFSKALKNPNKAPTPKSGANSVMRIGEAKKKKFKIEGLMEKDVSDIDIEQAQRDLKHAKLQKKIKAVKSESLARDLKTAEDAMGGSKTKEQGIQFVMDAMKVNKRKATQLVDKILKMKGSQKGKVTFKESDELILERDRRDMSKSAPGKEVAKRMMKIQTMKGFAPKVAKMKTVTLGDLEKMLPDYVSGGDINTVMSEGTRALGRGMSNIDRDVNVETAAKLLDAVRADNLISNSAYDDVKIVKDVAQEASDLASGVQGGPEDEGLKKTAGMIAKDLNRFAKMAEKELANMEKSSKRFEAAVRSAGGMIGKRKNLLKFREEAEIEGDVELVEGMKMNDPKLIKMFDRLKPNDVIKLKVDSSISKGKELQNYVVKSKTKVRRGQVDKITLILQGNPTGVKRFMYKKDGKVTFAIGDMAASIADIKEAVDPADIDQFVATKGDKEAAKMNIIVQLRKAADVRGNLDIVFQDGKKKRVPMNIITIALNKFNSFKRPATKEKLVKAMSKSYKDMLVALKTIKEYSNY